MQARLSAIDLDGVTTWTKSSKSGAAGHCVEAAPFGGGVAVRNSNDPGAGGLKFTGPEFSAFLEGAKAGEFDNLV